MTEPESSVPRASKRGPIIATIAVVVALLVGGVAGAALRSPKTKIVTQEHTVTVTSIVTQEVAPPSCTAALQELGSTLRVVGDEMTRLRSDAVANDNSDIATNYGLWLADINKSENAITASLKQANDVTTCQAAASG